MHATAFNGGERKKNCTWLHVSTEVENVEVKTQTNRRMMPT